MLLLSPKVTRRFFLQGSEACRPRHMGDKASKFFSKRLLLLLFCPGETNCMLKIAKILFFFRKYTTSLFMICHACIQNFIFEKKKKKKKMHSACWQRPVAWNLQLEYARELAAAVSLTWDNNLAWDGQLHRYIQTRYLTNNLSIPPSGIVACASPFHKCILLSRESWLLQSLWIHVHLHCKNAVSTIPFFIFLTLVDKLLL